MKALLLLSGGIDSPVAGWLAKQKGLSVIALHLSSEPITGTNPFKKSSELAKKLGFEKLICVEIGEALLKLAKNAEHKFYFVLQKRLMLKIAEKLAQREGCDFLVTGENLGQVSSQTLSNLHTITGATKLPIFRPLLTFDKLEIIKLAEQIGSFDISKGPEHCDALGPNKPATKSKAEIVVGEEEKLNIAQVVESCLQSAKVETFS